MKKINILLSVIFTFCCIASLKAQTAEKYTLVSNAEEARQIFDQIRAASNTIDADFIQEKKVDILENIITSKGKFLFKQKNSLRLEYTSPSYYLVVMAAGKMLIKDGDKKTKIDGKGSKMFSQIQNVMAGVLGGQMADNKEFKYELYKGETNYKIRLFPQTGAIKDLLKEVEFVTNKTTLKALSMTMFERSGDVTVMKFKNVKMNVPIDDKVFATH
ncbi:MAG: outer rane lipoprotein carrier protein LolA [Cytophagaceae bacterium]|jgi:outer membrane lipoprotein-sorting protein|nr:outer rane lipoprotein carrier protein LolA [Cytophagaceae bacterium]